MLAPRPPPPGRPAAPGGLPIQQTGSLDYLLPQGAPAPRARPPPPRPLGQPPPNSQHAPISAPSSPLVVPSPPVEQSLGGFTSPPARGPPPARAPPPTPPRQVDSAAPVLPVARGPPPGRPAPPSGPSILGLSSVDGAPRPVAPQGQPRPVNDPVAPLGSHDIARPPPGGPGLRGPPPRGPPPSRIPIVSAPVSDASPAPPTGEPVVARPPPNATRPVSEAIPRGPPPGRPSLPIDLPTLTPRPFTRPPPPSQPRGPPPLDDDEALPPPPPSSMPLNIRTPVFPSKPVVADAHPSAAEPVPRPTPRPIGAPSARGPPLRPTGPTWAAPKRPPVTPIKPGNTSAESGGDEDLHVNQPQASGHQRHSSGESLSAGSDARSVDTAATTQHVAHDLLASAKAQAAAIIAQAHEEAKLIRHAAETEVEALRSARAEALDVLSVNTFEVAEIGHYPPNIEAVIASTEGISLANADLNDLSATITSQTSLPPPPPKPIDDVGSSPAEPVLALARRLRDAQKMLGVQNPPSPVVVTSQGEAKPMAAGDVLVSVSELQMKIDTLQRKRDEMLLQQAQALGLAKDNGRLTPPHHTTSPIQADNHAGNTSLQRLSPTSNSWLASVIPKAGITAATSPKDKPMTSRQLLKATVDMMPPASAVKTGVHSASGPGFGSLYAGKSEVGKGTAPASQHAQHAPPSKTPTTQRDRSHRPSRREPDMKAAAAGLAKKAPVSSVSAAPRKAWGAPNMPWKEPPTRGAAQKTAPAPATVSQPHHKPIARDKPAHASVHNHERRRSGRERSRSHDRHHHRSHRSHRDYESDTSESASSSYTGSSDHSDGYARRRVDYGSESDSGSYSSYTGSSEGSYRRASRRSR